MTGESAFTIWRTAAGPWGQWIKASLFAQTPAGVEPQPLRLPNVGWAPPAGTTALVVDLPGVESVEIGCALAQRGYCPVPAFNTSPGAGEVVDTRHLMAALLGAVSSLSARTGGPPAFLLDLSRQGPEQLPADGDFDNRWFVFDSDFPSARQLRERGIERLDVVCRGGQISSDLRDALVHHAGVLELTLLDPDTLAQVPFPPPKARLIRGLMVLSRLFHRRLDGAFGRPITHG